MQTIEASDYSWFPCEDNLRRQARICIAYKMKPILMDLNISVGVQQTISSMENLDISCNDLQPSRYSNVVLQRGKKLFQLPVIGECELIVHHARGRSFRHRTSIDLERDAKAFTMKTIIIEKFPSECKFGILAGLDFLRDNGLWIDEKNGQIVNAQTYPAKTVIQYLSPDRHFYLRSHSLFWEKHYKPEANNSPPVKIVPPKSCENCGTAFFPIKKGENVSRKYKKGEMILYHGEVNYFPCKLGLTVQNYSNNHMIKAVYKKNRSKMILSVPECAVRRADEDESVVIPVKHNPSKNDDPPNLGSVKTEVVSKVETSTQTYSPSGLFPTEPNVQNEKEPKVQNKFYRIKSEFSECLYPFDNVEDWVNDCPSECSDLSYKSFPKYEDFPVFPNLSENDKKILLQLSDPSLREYFLGIRGMHSDFTPKFKIERRRQTFIEPKPYLKKDFTTNEETYDYPNISETEWFKNFEHSQAVTTNISSSHPLLTVPDRGFNLSHGDQDEDILGEAGGGEERGLRQSMYQPWDNL